MAKRRKKVKSRRRRIGALALNPASPLVKYGSAALGYFLGDKINDAISNATGDKVDGKIIAAAEAGIGLMLMLMMKKAKKSLPLTIAAGVLTGAGVKKALSEFGIINGFSDVPVLAGYKSVPVLSGYNTRPGAMNGFNVPEPMNSSRAVMGGFGGLDEGSGINEDDR